MYNKKNSKNKKHENLKKKMGVSRELNSGPLAP